MAAGEPQGPADCGGGLHPGLLTLQGDARQGPGRRGGGHSLKQCCGAGAEIILRPGAGAEIIIIINIFCSQFGGC